MTAGKWIALDRGLTEPETEAAPWSPIPPCRFPLLQRLDDDTFRELMAFRMGLPALSVSDGERG